MARPPPFEYQPENYHLNAEVLFPALSNFNSFTETWNCFQIEAWNEAINSLTLTILVQVCSSWITLLAIKMLSDAHVNRITFSSQNKISTYCS